MPRGRCFSWATNRIRMVGLLPHNAPPTPGWKFHEQTYFRDRRRGQLAGQGTDLRLDRLLLEQRGLRVRLQKFDPYLNVDPGTMSPYQHGEVFVTDDGAETDLDLGHYERFTTRPLTATATSPPAGSTISHQQGAARRLSGQDRAGDSARHQRDQGRHAQAWRPRRRRGASPRSAARSATSRACRSWKPSASSRHDVGSENCLFIHLTLVPVPQGGRRAEDQADAALGRATCGRSASSPTS